jgi:DNA repair protein RecO (recombination protein O)
LLEILSELNFFEQVTNRFNQSQRKMLLELLLKYYEIHLYDFRWPKSLEVLNVVFE